MHYIIEFYECGIYKTKKTSNSGRFLKLLASVDNCPLSSVVVVLVNGRKVGYHGLQFLRSRAREAGFYGLANPPRPVPPPPSRPRVQQAAQGPVLEQWRAAVGIEDVAPLSHIPDSVFKREAERINRIARRKPRAKALPPIIKN